MEFFRILWRLLKPFKRQFGVYLVLIFLLESSQLADSYLISLVIGFVERGFDRQVFLIALGVVLAFDEISRFLDRRVDWQVVVNLWNPIYRYLKRATLRKFMEMEMRWHYQQRSGTLMGKVQEGTSKVLDMVMSLSWEFVPTLIQAVVSLVPLLFLSIPIVGVILGSLVVFVLITLRQHRAQEPLWRERYDSYDLEWGRAQEMVSGVEVVSLFGQRDRFLQDHREVLTAISDTSEKEAQLWVYGYGKWRHRIQGLARRLVLALLVLQVSQGEMTIASMVFIWTLTERLFHAFWRFARLHDNAGRALEAARRLEEVILLEPTLADPDDPRPVPAGPVTLTFRGVSFSYSSATEEDTPLNGNHYQIDNLDLTIHGGETVGIVGPSGAGKTTLLRLLTRSWDVTEGAVLVNGVDVRNIALSALRTIFAHVPQEDQVVIFNESFLFNISLGRPSAAFVEVEDAAKAAGIHDFIVSCEDGYKTLLGEKGLRLSGGQKQRVSLARALLADCPVLILDEATSSVDSITEDEIQHRLLPIFRDRQRTVLIIAHRLSTIWGVADRILVFDKGRLVEEGTHEKLFALRGLYAELLMRQSEKMRELLLAKKQ
jgi:ABC-type multidrug transport system fused ATPase/permease subunit